MSTPLFSSLSRSLSRWFRTPAPGFASAVAVTALVASMALTACNADSRTAQTAQAAQQAAPAHDAAHATAAASPAEPAASAQGTVTLVETDKVCMVNDQYFGTAQIPVEVNGKTYYGCCEGCKATLAEDATARMAVDPVSRKPVDKAVAHIGAFPNGQVLYFESAANLAAWNKR